MVENLTSNQLDKPDAVLINKSLDLLMNSDLIGNHGMVFKTSCKVCNSDSRLEVEKMFEEGNSLVKISEFLKSKGTHVAPMAVGHHMMEHFKSMERTMLLMDYCENLSAMMNRRHDKLDDIEMLINVSRLELARAISIPTKGDLTKEKMRSDMIAKAQDSMADHIRLFNEMEDSESKTKAMYSKLISVWKYHIENSKTEEEKNIYRNTLKQFQTALMSTPTIQETPK